MPSSFEHLMLVKESSYGTPFAAPVAGTDSIYIRLPDSNSFTMIADPVISQIQYGGGYDVPAEFVSDYIEVKGGLTTNLYTSQAAFILGWALQRVDAAQTLPWAQTSEPVGDLASVSCYHAVMRNDGSIKRTRYAGVKCTSFRIEANRGAPVWKVSMDLVAQKFVGNTFDGSSDPTTTEFPDPLETSYPTNPYLFQHSSGGLLLGSGSGTVRSQYESLALAVANTIDARPFESRFLQVAAFRGRRSTLDVALRLKATPDDDAAYLALAAQRAQLTLTNGANSVVVNFQGNNFLSRRARDLPLNKVFMRTLTITNAFSQSAANDLSYTVT
jgi:hypothetical protein